MPDPSRTPPHADSSTTRSEPRTAICSTCGHRPHQPGGCKARYHVTFTADDPGDPCLCENQRAAAPPPPAPLDVERLTTVIRDLAQDPHDLALHSAYCANANSPEGWTELAVAILARLAASPEPSDG